MTEKDIEAINGHDSKGIQAEDPDSKGIQAEDPDSKGNQENGALNPDKV